MDSALVASLVNFMVALVLVVVALTLRPRTRQKLAGLRTWLVPRWTFSAGLGGAVVVLAGALTVETIGVAVFSIAFFAGQIAFGLVVDGSASAPVASEPSPPPGCRRWGWPSARWSSHNSIGMSASWRPLIAFVIAAGAGVAFQSAFNGRIAAATGDPVAATAINVIVGTTALALLVGRSTPQRRRPAWSPVVCSSSVLSRGLAAAPPPSPHRRLAGLARAAVATYTPHGF